MNNMKLSVSNVWFTRKYFKISPDRNGILAKRDTVDGGRDGQARDKT